MFLQKLYDKGNETKLFTPDLCEIEVKKAHITKRLLMVLSVFTHL